MAYQNIHVEEQASWFKRNLRKVVGWSYIAADAAMAGRGFSMIKGINDEIDRKGYSPDSEEFKKLTKEKSDVKWDIGGMGIWAAGGIAMARYGNRPLEKEYTSLKNKLAAYLHDQGVNLEGDALEVALREKNKSVLKKIEDFAYQYPSEIMHAAFAIGSVGLIKGGLSEFKGPDKKFGTLGMGICCIIGALIGVMVKEKTPEELAKLGSARGMGDKASRWLQANANKTTSAFYLANNAFSAMSVFEDYKTYNDPKYKKYNADRAESKYFKNLFGWRVGALSTYIFGAGVLSATSKSSGFGGKMGEKAKEHIFNDMASICNEQPPEIRTQMIGMVSQYLSNRRELGMSSMDAAEISEKITHALDEVSKPKTWAERANQSFAMSDTERSI